VSLGIVCFAKTARPAVGVWRISKKGESGAPTGRPLSGGDGGGAEEDDEGREALVGVWMEEGALSVESMVVCMVVTAVRLCSKVHTLRYAPMGLDPLS
jgi:hypothetical protein